MLQEATEQEAEEANSDVDVTAYAGKIDKDNDNMIILMEEDHKSLEYQDTMKVDVEIIA